jgi:8-oxo-dGTP diphosphatase
MMVVDVAIGIFSRDDKVLLSRRPSSVHQPLLWEFPGGKRQPGEAFYTALCRELDEELGVTIQAATEWLSVWHQYADYSVLLQSFLIQDFLGEPAGQEGQPISWVDKSALWFVDFPEANYSFLAGLDAI